MTTWRLLLAVLFAGTLIGACEDDPTDRAEVIVEHWADIKDYADGSAVVEACNETGSCYDLEADVSNGTIETVHFTNGRYLTVSADIDADGSASDTDQRGRSWDFTIDMSTSWA